MTIQGLKDYRCPQCKSDRCGNDANAGWDVVTQQSVLLGEFDAQWCNDCGDVTLEEFEITDAQEIARIDAARAALATYMANISPRKTGLVSFGYKLLLADAKKVRRVTS